jgi:hypothetical protein
MEYEKGKDSYEKGMEVTLNNWSRIVVRIVQGEVADN